MRIGDWSSDVCSSDLAGLGAGAGEPLSAEGLHAHHRADLVAVDVDVADLGARRDVLDRLVDARVDAQGQAVAGGVEGVDHLVQLAGLPEIGRASCGERGGKYG